MFSSALNTTNLQESAVQTCIFIVMIDSQLSIEVETNQVKPQKVIILLQTHHVYFSCYTTFIHKTRYTSMTIQT